MSINKNLAATAASIALMGGLGLSAVAPTAAHAQGGTECQTSTVVARKVSPSGLPLASAVFTVTATNPNVRILAGNKPGSVPAYDAAYFAALDRIAPDGGATPAQQAEARAEADRVAGAKKNLSITTDASGKAVVSLVGESEGTCVAEVAGSLVWRETKAPAGYSLAAPKTVAAATTPTTTGATSAATIVDQPLAKAPMVTKSVQIDRETWRTARSGARIAAFDDDGVLRYREGAWMWKTREGRRTTSERTQFVTVSLPKGSSTAAWIKAINAKTGAVGDVKTTSKAPNKAARAGSMTVAWELGAGAKPVFSGLAWGAGHNVNQTFFARS